MEVFRILLLLAIFIRSYCQNTNTFLTALASSSSYWVHQTTYALSPYTKCFQYGILEGYLMTEFILGQKYEVLKNTSDTNTKVDICHWYTHVLEIRDANFTMNMTRLWAFQAQDLGEDDLERDLLHGYSAHYDQFDAPEVEGREQSVNEQ
ncbi:uncharacterized protein LOC119163853 isoform X4 [Rhipicephalus microplus]|uniref:uncharacterized protein LOC119163853 isoform X4 n=1 Tax=Rhipicephalus microplus TaxID=6941 RepID=UPI003F6D78C2